MRILVKSQEETIPEEPDEPQAKDASDIQVKKCEKELSQCCKKLDKHEECKAKAFVIVKGQCTLTMKNKAESMKDCKKIEQDDDIIGLLKSPKELAFTTVDVQHEHWTVNQST